MTNMHTQETCLSDSVCWSVTQFALLLSLCIIQVRVLIIYRLLLITCTFCHASMSDAIELFLKHLLVSQDTFCLTHIINVAKVSPVFT